MCGCFGADSETESRTASCCSSQEMAAGTCPRASSERVNLPSVCRTLGVHSPTEAWGKMINSWGRPLASSITSGAQLGSGVTHLLSIIFRRPCHIL